MARQPYQVNASQKKVEVFSTFGGGMVTQPHPERLLDSQSVLLENVEVLAGGVVQNRGAYKKTNDPSPAVTGTVQGRFKYENLAGGQDIIAINGKLYLVTGNTYTNIAITGLTSFQTTRTIEAVQHRDKMYFATGSGIVEYNGTTAALLSAYKPTGLEALYVGTNGYSTNPSYDLADVVGAGNAILAVVPFARYGEVNKPVTIKSYIQYITGQDTKMEYLWEYKLAASTKYTVFKDWSTAGSISIKFAAKGDYMIRCTMRHMDDPDVNLSQYILPKFKVNSTPEEKPEPAITFDDMKLCNRIFIHYDRLFLYGDTGNPDFLYISHLNRFDYFPRTNIIKVVDPLRGALNNVTRYKEFLVCFTNGSIQMITGRNPNEFDLQPVHTTLGTKWGDSVQVMKNYLVFTGNDNAIYILKSFQFASTNKMNVERIDEDIQDDIISKIAAATNVLSCIYNDQYYLYIKSATTRYIYRYYYELGIWVRDTLPFDIQAMNNVNNVIFMTSTTGGKIYKLTKDSYYDDVSTPFTINIKSKDFDFGMPHHRKKMKEYQILAKINTSTIVTKVYGDNNILVTKNVVKDAQQNSDAQKLKVLTSGKFRYTKTELSIQVIENIQLIGFGFIFKENTPK